MVKDRLLRWTRRLVLLFLIGSCLPVLLLRWVDPPVTAFILADYLSSERDVRRIRQDWGPLDRISPHLQLAVIAAEDQKFPSHWGFDLDSILDAIEGNREGRRLRGASTITQQVAKNLFLWSGQSYLRKGLEAWFTLLIELLWSKERILEVYLNVAEFGPGTYGAEAGSRLHFGHPAAGLDAYRASLLAAILPNPKRFSASRPSAYVLERAVWIRTQMRQLGAGHLAAVRGRG